MRNKKLLTVILLSLFICCLVIYGSYQNNSVNAEPNTKTKFIRIDEQPTEQTESLLNQAIISFGYRIVYTTSAYIILQK